MDPIKPFYLKGFAHSDKPSETLSLTELPSVCRLIVLVLRNNKLQLYCFGSVSSFLSASFLKSQQAAVFHQRMQTEDRHKVS